MQRCERRREKEREREKTQPRAEVEANRGRRAREGKGARVGEGSGRKAREVGRGRGMLAINAPHKKSSPSLMGSTLLEGTCRVSSRGVKRKERKHAEG